MARRKRNPELEMQAIDPPITRGEILRLNLVPEAEPFDMQVRKMRDEAAERASGKGGTNG